MAVPRKSLRGIKTMAGLVDRRRSRTSAGALLEMSALANEKERLHQELAAARRRRKEIKVRLTEIAAKERRLQKFLTAPRLEGEAPTQAGETRCGLKLKEFNY